MILLLLRIYAVLFGCEKLFMVSDRHGEEFLFRVSFSRRMSTHEAIRAMENALHAEDYDSWLQAIVAFYANQNTSFFFDNNILAIKRIEFIGLDATTVRTQV